jgi:Rrf2 family nitric oxide-sensitive transcriptional repressor
MDCQLRGMLRAGMKAFYDAMDRYTLAHATAGGTGEQVVRMHRMFWEGAAAKRSVPAPEPVSED